MSDVDKVIADYRVAWRRRRRYWRALIAAAVIIDLTGSLVAAWVTARVLT